jgi:hypothetical protein
MALYSLSSIKDGLWLYINDMLLVDMLTTLDLMKDDSLKPIGEDISHRITKTIFSFCFT